MSASSLSVSPHTENEWVELAVWLLANGLPPNAHEPSMPESTAPGLRSCVRAAFNAGTTDAPEPPIPMSSNIVVTVCRCYFEQGRCSGLRSPLAESLKNDGGDNIKKRMRLLEKIVEEYKGRLAVLDYEFER